MIDARFVNPIKLSADSISSVSSLCDVLDISQKELGEVLALSGEERYSSKEISKAGGKSRIVHNPHKLVRKIQRRINNRIFTAENYIQWPSYLYGSVSNQEYDVEDDQTYLNGKDYVSCAARHCQASSILKLDVQDFFDNIHIGLVEQVFKDFLCFPEPVAKVLANLCSRNEHLLQGALTSSYLASLCLWDVEGKVAERLGRKGLVYTRLVDDITVSSKSIKTDFTYAKNIIIGMLESKDLPVNEAKTQVHRASTKPLTVHGLRVGFSTPRLPADEVRRIRAAVRNVESLAEEPNYRVKHAYRKDFNVCMGRVNKLQRVGHSQYDALVSRLEKVQPLPSKRDIGRVRSMIERLRSDYPKRAHTYWYRVRFYKVHERLNILKRTYRHEALDFRIELKALKPPKSGQ
ncbi:reverse transcriptase family protein [Pseudomonas putida]|uniref:reverse transcriptase family protein n=1 Tax=Pseudomonas putida TaxID=303 RepID=UPI001F52AAD4|nr:reverse transcriptase family protein [Pseudomonas putida]MCI0913614.1 RNA-directed DNA polymerase [Pseudomonas putida]